MRIKEFVADLGNADFKCKLDNASETCMMELIPLDIVKAIHEHIGNIIQARENKGKVSKMAKTKAAKPAVKKPATKAKK
jgi:hypothetical protein